MATDIPTQPAANGPQTVPAAFWIAAVVTTVALDVLQFLYFECTTSLLLSSALGAPVFAYPFTLYWWFVYTPAPSTRLGLRVIIACATVPAFLMVALLFLISHMAP